MPMPMPMPMRMHMPRHMQSHMCMHMHMHMHMSRALQSQRTVWVCARAWSGPPTIAPKSTQGLSHSVHIWLRLQAAASSRGGHEAARWCGRRG